METNKTLKLVSLAMMLISLLICFSASYSDDVYTVGVYIDCPDEAIHQGDIEVTLDDWVQGRTAYKGPALWGFAEKNGVPEQEGSCNHSK
jgi:hypothetical protein